MQNEYFRDVFPIIFKMYFHFIQEQNQVSIVSFLMKMINCHPCYHLLRIHFTLFIYFSQIIILKCSEVSILNPLRSSIKVLPYIFIGSILSLRLILIPHLCVNISCNLSCFNPAHPDGDTVMRITLKVNCHGECVIRKRHNMISIVAMTRIVPSL